MLDTSNVKSYMQDFFTHEPYSMNRSLSNFLNKLISEYDRYSHELGIIKNISKGWIKSFVNRKAILALVKKLRNIKYEILSLINSHSKFRNKFIL